MKTLKSLQTAGRLYCNLVKHCKVWNPSPELTFIWFNCFYLPLHRRKMIATAKGEKAFQYHVAYIKIRGKVKYKKLKDNFNRGVDLPSSFHCWVLKQTCNETLVKTAALEWWILCSESFNDVVAALLAAAPDYNNWQLESHDLKPHPSRPSAHHHCNSCALTTQMISWSELFTFTVGTEDASRFPACLFFSWSSLQFADDHHKFEGGRLCLQKIIMIITTRNNNKQWCRHHCWFIIILLSLLSSSHPSPPPELPAPQPAHHS